MGDETIAGGYVLGETLDLGTLGEDDVTQVDTALNPEDNLYTVRFYGRDGELLQEQQVPVQFAEYDAATTVSNDDVLQNGFTFDNDEWEIEMPEPRNTLGIQHLELTGDGLNFYGEDGELLWSADGVGMYTAQGTSSAEYRTALNMSDLWQVPIYDADTRIDDDARYGNPYVRRYVEGELRDRAEDYLRVTYGTRTEQREEFLRTRSRHLDEIFLKGEWKIPEEEEQPDIEDERGGALDEFLNGFKPQKTKSERSDEQE